MSPDQLHAVRLLRAYLDRLLAQGPPRVYDEAAASTTPASATSPRQASDSTRTALNKDSGSDTPEVRQAALDALRLEASACRACPLGSQRKQAVFGVGQIGARLLFVGEAPGAREDEQGEPFVGPAGQLLTSTLAQFGVGRQDVYICNVIKCRPPGNRDPLPDEIAACRPFLHKQIDLVKPQYLATLGRFAAALLLERPVAMMRERGSLHQYRGLPLFLSLHPSAVLHNPASRNLLVQDLDTLVRLSFPERREG